MIDETGDEPNDIESVNDVMEDEKFDVVYSCLRCATKVSSADSVSYTHLTLPTILLV